MIRGCVFDFGGVMTTMTMPDRVRPLVKELGLDWKVIEDGFAKYRRQMDGDFMTLEEMYRRIWSDAGIVVSKETNDRILKEDTASFLYRNEDTLALMRSLKSRGFRIGILTNMSSAFGVRFRETFPDFVELADAMVISGEAKMYKPMREIYDLLRERIALPAEELCFFDDVEANCQGARDAGWKTVRFTDCAQAARDFEALLAG